MSEGFSKTFTKAEIEAMRHAAGDRAAGDEEGVRRDFWAKLRRVGRHIPFAEDLVAAYFCTLDPNTPGRVKAILLGAIAYFVLPIDGLADFLPLIGFTDDAAILAAAIAAVAGSITMEHRARAQEVLRDPDTTGEGARTAA